jgi:hypothetical protein
MANSCIENYQVQMLTKLFKLVDLLASYKYMDWLSHLISWLEKWIQNVDDIRALQLA